MRGTVAGAEMSKAINYLYAFIKVYPNRIHELTDHLDGVEASDIRYQLTISALGLAGTEESEGELVRLGHRFEADSSKLGAIIQSMGVAKTPGKNIEEFLLHSKRNLTNQRLRGVTYLALGNVSNGVRAEDRERAEGIVELLTSELRSVKDPGIIITALGNTRSVSVVEPISEFLDHGRSDIRALSARSLRHVKTKLSDRFLRDLAATDASFKVRQEAIRAMGTGSVSHDQLEFQKDRLAIEENEVIRADIVRIVWKNREEYKMAESIVRDAAINDKSVEVQKVARVLLQEDGIFLPLK